MYLPWVYLRGGVERWLLEVTTRSRHDWVVYTHHYDAARTFPELSQTNIVTLDPEVSVRRALRPLIHAAGTIARTQLPDDGASVVLVSSEGLGDLVALREKRPLVCYCHTPLKILHDPITRVALRRRSSGQAAMSRVLGFPFTALDRSMWKRYERILVNSQETAQRVQSARLADDVEVLRPGVDPKTWSRHVGLPRRQTLLVAGRIMWQKQIELAFETLRRLRNDYGMSHLDLVVAGAVDAKSRTYLSQLHQSARDLPVRFVLDPTDEELSRLYASCSLLLFTPPNEDWGIVPLEAMAAGLPVVAVASGGPTESIEHGRSGWLVDNNSIAMADAVAGALSLSESDLAGHRVEAQLRADSFPWDAMVARLDDVLDEVAASAETRNA